MWLVSSVRTAVRVTNLDGTKLKAPDNAAEIRDLLDCGDVSVELADTHHGEVNV